MLQPDVGRSIEHIAPTGAFVEGLREAIVRGLGIGVISETEFAPHPQLHPLMVSGAEMYTRAYIACLKARRNRPLIREFLTLATSLVENRKK